MRREPYYRRAYRELHRDVQDSVGEDFFVPLGVGNPSEFPERRNMAYCAYRDHNSGERDITIMVAPKLTRGSQDRIQAILRHELAHAIEFHLGEKELRRRVRNAGYSLPRGTERRADKLAEIIWGDPIFYDEILVQSLGKGTRPRPRHLGL